MHNFEKSLIGKDRARLLAYSIEKITKKFQNKRICVWIGRNIKSVIEDLCSSPPTDVGLIIQLYATKMIMGYFDLYRNYRYTRIKPMPDSAEEALWERAAERCKKLADWYDDLDQLSGKDEPDD